jgi:hypothetical protein
MVAPCPRHYVLGDRSTWQSQVWLWIINLTGCLANNLLFDKCKSEIASQARNDRIFRHCEEALVESDVAVSGVALDNKSDRLFG